uniref:Uncharacterized protein n=1 Tax=Fagus sylvatica TaxID=28930 RepID=A0A2N9EQD1_FAGSY
MRRNKDKDKDKDKGQRRKDRQLEYEYRPIPKYFVPLIKRKTVFGTILTTLPTTHGKRLTTALTPKKTHHQSSGPSVRRLTGDPIEGNRAITFGAEALMAESDTREGPADCGVDGLHMAVPTDERK